MKQSTGTKKAPRPAKPKKPAADAAAASPSADTAAVLRKRELVDRVAEASGVKKKDTRAVVDAVLAELGAALSRGDELVLPPLGKARVNRTKEKGVGEVLVLKLRRGGGEKPGAKADEALAKADD